MAFKIKHHFLFFLVCCISVGVAEAQEIRFENLTTENGLSQSTAYGITQDRYGFIWIGTTDGLNRFDGHNLVKYYHETDNEKSLPNNFTSAVYNDKQGNLWVGTLKGLALFDHQTETFKRFARDENGNDIGRVACIFEDNQANLWVGTVGNGLKLLDRKTGSFTKKFAFQNNEILKDGSVRSIAQDKEGNLYIALQYKGLAVIDAQFTNLRLFQYKEDNPTSLSSNEVSSICITQDQTIWVGTYGGGLNRLDIKNQHFTHYRYNQQIPNTLASDFVNGVMESSTGEIWVATEKGGLNLLQPAENGDNYFISFQKKDTNPKSITINELYTLFEDKSGVLWVGTVNGGVNYFDLWKRNQFLHYWHDSNNANSLSHNSIRRIFEDRDVNLWVCTSQEGVNLATPRDRKLGIFQKPRFEYVGIGNSKDYQNSPYRFAIDICQDQKGTIWVATFGGLFEYAKDHFESRLLLNPQDSTVPHLPSKQIRSVFCDSKNNLWIGMIEGLSVWDSDRKKLTTLYPSKDTAQANMLKISIITCFAEDKQGNIWFGMQGGGLRVYNPQNQQVKSYRTKEGDAGSLPSERITTIYIDQEGIVWVGTSGGLARFDSQNQRFTTFGKKDGFPNEVIYGILEDKNKHLWLSGNKGIIQFDKQTKQIRTFDVSDGLQNNEFNLNAFHKNPRGEMFFGGINGFNAFFPERIVKRSFKPSVVIMDFQLGGKSMNNYGKDQILEQSIITTQAIVLSHQQSIFSFEFTALDFSNHKKIKYKYKMEGFDTEWNLTDAARPYATYTNLSPETYTFMVKATNGDGVWNEDGVTKIRITITPPFWKTWWFVSLAIFLFLLFAFTLYKSRINQIKQQQLVLEKLVKERTAELEDANIHLANNVRVIDAQKSILEKQTERLRSANEQLVDLGKFKEGLTNMIVHDLKNPLNTILGLSVQQEVLQATRQMLNMVLNILDVQKFEATAFKLSISTQRLIKLTYNSLNEVRLLIERKSLEIINDIPLTINVSVDAEIIERVMVNLLTNAIKHTPNNGKIRLYVNPTFVKTSRGWITVAISDTGVGIPMDKLDVIFEKFIQVDALKSGSVHSTGLGLAFCKMAVEAHQGQIGVQSCEGEGATFWFSLPLSEMQNENMPAQLPENEENYYLTAEKIELAEIEKNTLKPYLAKLAQLSVYQYSEVREVLDEMQIAETRNLLLWKRQIENALRACNEEKYDELLNL
jgi:ligand-binding sensor domain-containing protein/signal transduction histidine kinase